MILFFYKFYYIFIDLENDLIFIIRYVVLLFILKVRKLFIFIKKYNCYLGLKKIYLLFLNK